MSRERPLAKCIGCMSLTPLQLQPHSWSFKDLEVQGKLAATAVNAPMVPAEVLAELQPFVALAQGLGRAAVQLVAEQGFSDVRITYYSPRGDDLDTRYNH